MTAYLEAPLAFDRTYVHRRFEPGPAGASSSGDASPEKPLPGAPSIVALHGSGADEMAMLPLARLLDPTARIIAPRGRIMQNGERRWYRKTTAIAFDQSSIRFEAEAFAGFLGKLAEDRLIGPSAPIFFGYSNGANLIAATMLLYPGLIRRAVLLRAMPVLDKPPSADLKTARVLVIGGAADSTYGSYSSALDELLRKNGATVVRETVRSGHEVGAADIRLARNWLDSLEGEAPGAIADTAPVRT